MNANRLNEALKRSAQLMNDPQFNRIVEGKAKNVPHVADGGAGTTNIAALEAQCFGYASTDNAPQQTVTEFQSPLGGANKNGWTEEKIKESKLPQNIKEHYLAQLKEEKSKNVVTTTPLPVANNAPMPNSNIDYSIMKAIMEEIINRKFEEIKKEISTENSLRAFKINDGNRIQFLDKKGNLYEAELKLKKKASDKK